MATRPNIAQGARLLLSTNGTTWVEAELLTQLSGVGGFSSSSVDTTNLNSDEMASIKGLSDSKEISLSIQFDTVSAFDAILSAHRAAYGADAAASLHYKVLVPFASTPSTFAGRCYVTDYSGIESSVNGLATASITIKPQGAPTVTAGATT